MHVDLKVPIIISYFVISIFYFNFDIHVYLYGLIPFLLLFSANVSFIYSCLPFLYDNCCLLLVSIIFCMYFLLFFFEIWKQSYLPYSWTLYTEIWLETLLFGLLIVGSISLNILPKFRVFSRVWLLCNTPIRYVDLNLISTCLYPDNCSTTKCTKAIILS